MLMKPTDWFIGNTFGAAEAPRLSASLFGYFSSYMLGFPLVTYDGVPRSSANESDWKMT